MTPAKRAARERTEQGLPTQITDPTALAAIAQLITNPELDRSAAA